MLISVVKQGACREDRGAAAPCVYRNDKIFREVTSTMGPSLFFLAAAEIRPLDALRSLDLEQVLLPVVCQLAVIVVASRVFSILFRKLWQPGVVGEIAAGLVLGPSVLGYFFPEVVGPGTRDFGGIRRRTLPLPPLVPSPLASSPFTDS